MIFWKVKWNIAWVGQPSHPPFQVIVTTRNSTFLVGNPNLSLPLPLAYWKVGPTTPTRTNVTLFCWRMRPESQRQRVTFANSPRPESSSEAPKKMDVKQQMNEFSLAFVPKFAVDDTIRTWFNSCACFCWLQALSCAYHDSHVSNLCIQWPGHWEIAPRSRAGKKSGGRSPKN